MEEQDGGKWWKDFQQRHTAAVGYAQSALQSFVLVNGGALVALLTFVGNSDVEVGPRGIFWSFVWFALGLSVALFAHFLVYWSQIKYLESARFRMDDFLRETKLSDRTADQAACAAVIALLTSLTSFLAGSFVGLYAIT